MKVVGLDHIVLRVRDREETLRFYGDLLGMEKLRVQEWHDGKAPFPSVRISEGTIIDLVSRNEGELALDDDAPRNLDHFCLVAAPGGWEHLLQELQDAGIISEAEILERWGARGSGKSVYIHDPDGNQIEIKTYA